MKKASRWCPITLFLHLVMAIAVLLQLATSQLWDYSSVLFTLHEISGVTALSAVVLFLLWKIIKGGLLNCFPWLTSQGRAHILSDIRWISKLRLPEHNAGGLPGLIQGLGLLVILAMGLLGCLWFLGKFSYVVFLTPYAHVLIHWHSNLATLVWVYVCGHTAMAVIHWVLPRRFTVEC
jgi:hypothetical protein